MYPLIGPFLPREGEDFLEGRFGGDRFRGARAEHDHLAAYKFNIHIAHAITSGRLYLNQVNKFGTGSPTCARSHSFKLIESYLRIELCMPRKQTETKASSQWGFALAFVLIITFAIIISHGPPWYITLLVAIVFSFIMSLLWRYETSSWHTNKPSVHFLLSFLNKPTLFEAVTPSGERLIANV